jgi:hypothetical protein
LGGRPAKLGALGAVGRVAKAKPMTDLKNPAMIWTKGFLFLVLGLLASVLVVLQAPSVTIALLLLLSVWAFCRFYYFAFYVIQHYVDSTYRFSGLLSFLHYAFRQCRKRSRG